MTANASSAVTRHADAVLLTGGHKDTLSVKTSSYVQALIALYGLIFRLAGRAHPSGTRAAEKGRQQIQAAALCARGFLTCQRGEIQELAQKFAAAERVFVLGTGPNAGTAEEASLKVIEMAKMQSDSQDLENFLHGRLRQVDQLNPLFVIAPQGRASGRILDFLTVTHHIQAPSVVLTDEITPGIQSLAAHIVHLPTHLNEYFTPLVYIIPLYLFGYEMALQRGYDPNARRYNLVPQNVRFGDNI